MLERILKPIAYTEQAAAVSSRDARALASSDSDYRDVVAKGARYSGIEYVEASYRRNSLRASFLELFQQADAIVTPTVAVTAFPAGALGVDAGRRHRRRPPPRLVAVLLADKSDRAAGRDDSLRIR